LHHPDIDELVAGMEDMATLPATIVELLTLLDNPVSSAENVQKVLERDVAMTANILKLGNSAYYGSRRKISSVRQAIVLLGNRSVATLAFAAGMAPILRRDLVNYNISRGEFWDHSLISAAASSQAADQLGCSHLRCEAFTLGLVHDVGMLIIDNWLDQQDLKLEISDQGCHDFRTAEVACLGFDHAAVGASLAQRWGFPGLFTEVIAQHHDLDHGPNHVPGETGKLVRAVAAGNLMASFINEDMDRPETGGRKIQKNSAEFAGKLDQLGIDPDSMEELRLALTENLEETLTSATRCTVLN
jgi:HD-like signal output (HDOD) protein